MPRPPGSVSHLKPRFVLVAPLISGNGLSLAPLLFALFLPSTFASCLVVVVSFFLDFPLWLSAPFKITTRLYLNYTQHLFHHHVCLSLFTTCRFPPGVSVSPHAVYHSPTSTHYAITVAFFHTLSFSSLFSFLSSSLWPATERIINEHHKALSLLAVLWVSLPALSF